MSTNVDQAVDFKTRLAVGVSIVSLLVSSLSLIFTLTDDVDADRLEARLACLELPGPNDCGPER